VIGIFVGIPVGLFVLITLLVLAPSMIRGGRQHAAEGWSGPPEWFGARPTELTASSPDTSDHGDEPDSSRQISGRGGAGGTW
jgi:hypothetical protein